MLKTIWTERDVLVYVTHKTYTRKIQEKTLLVSITVTMTLIVSYNENLLDFKLITFNHLIFISIKKKLSPSNNVYHDLIIYYYGSTSFPL